MRYTVMHQPSGSPVTGLERQERFRRVQWSSHVLDNGKNPVQIAALENIFHCAGGEERNVFFVFFKNLFGVDKSADPGAVNVIDRCEIHDDPIVQGVPVCFNCFANPYYFRADHVAFDKNRNL